eukprot:Hpha_TRINITY_DN9853_c0_g2::TRINITY_DN9853_c0_g2_i1::g.81417::m.81417
MKLCGVVSAIFLIPVRADYYSGIDSTAKDDELKGQLQALISVKTTLSYNDIWDAFAVIDKFADTYPCDPNNLNKIPDVYSRYCWDPTIKHVDGVNDTGECGNYHKEGDCFNREHIWPKSWFGGFSSGDGAQTDIFELWPSDGYVNGLRANLPLGNVDRSQATYTSTNGCVIGPCAKPDGFSGSCFEVTDKLKGDVARSYFYLSTCYWNKWECCDTGGTNGSYMKPWLENQMREWHTGDPVDDQERKRNDEIYTNWQKNRNPFIDHPEWVAQISDF